MSIIAPVIDGNTIKYEISNTHNPNTEYPAQEPISPANILARIPIFSPFLVINPAIQPTTLPIAKEQTKPNLKHRP